MNELAILISKKEKGVKEVNIAQIKDILKAINTISGGLFYKLVKVLF
jgi:hypothetical protein